MRIQTSWWGTKGVFFFFQLGGGQNRAEVKINPLFRLLSKVFLFELGGGQNRAKVRINKVLFVPTPVKGFFS